jgi:hypothetical protein
MPVLAFVFSFCSANAAGPLGTIRVGQWSGGAYTNEADGTFSHCAAAVPYQSGIALLVGLGKSRDWTLAFIHPEWKLTVGESFPISLTFDGQEQFNVFGVVQSPIFVIVPMPQNSSLLSLFRKSHGMVAFAKGNSFKFALTSTSQLMAVLSNCVDRMNRGGLKAAGDFSVNTSPSPVQPPEPASVTIASSLKPNAPDDYKVEAMEIATNFILKSTLQNPRILTRSELPAALVANGASWKSEEAFGSVKIVHEEGAKGVDIASAIAAADSKECKGKFMTGRAAELVDSDVVFRGFAICEDTDGGRSAQYFVVPRKKGGFIVLSVVADMKTEASRGIMKDEKISGLSKAALIATGFNQ